MTNRRILAALAALSILSACGGGTGSLPKAAQQVPPAYNGPTDLARFTWGKQYLSDAQYLSPVTTGNLGMQVQVHMQNDQGLYQYASMVSNPKSPLYRHFLTPDEIAARFGASAADYAKTAAYFEQYGLHVGGWPQREQLFVSGPISALQSAFGTTFGVYRKDGQNFVAPVGTPHFTQTVPVDAVVGLMHANLMHANILRASNANFNGYSPQQVQRAFDFTGAYSGKYDGTGVTVGIVGTGPISSADLSKLSSVFGVRVATVTQPPVTDQGVAAALKGQPLPSPAPSTSPPPVYPDSTGLQSPPPVTDPFSSACQANAGLPTCNPEDGEAQLDTQTIATLAPGANVDFYLGYNPNDCFLGQNTTCAAGTGYAEEGIGEMDAEIQQMIADNAVDAVSISVGGGEPLNEGYYFNQAGQGFGPVEYATLASEGVAVFISSGDTGAFECSGFAAFYGITQLISTPCSSYPASDPSVVSVGGVTAPLDDSGRVTTQITAWGDQTTWGGNGTFQNNVGSGGGISTFFAAPSWQAGNTSVNTVVKGMRGQPDISMLADPATGPAMVMNAAFPDAWGSYGGVFPTGGTSLAAPQMAAMWALVLQACKQDAVCAAKGTGSHPYRLGNPNPLLYAIYGNATQYADTMDDVLYGNNSAFPPSPSPSSTPMPGYQAGKGYDLVTGVGVPFAGHLINTVIANEGGTSPNLP